MTANETNMSKSIALVEKQFQLSIPKHFRGLVISHFEWYEELCFSLDALVWYFPICLQVSGILSIAENR